ncbi:MAG: metallophosphoesterase [candidate division WOR-3 bacterium]
MTSKRAGILALGLLVLFNLACQWDQTQAVCRKDVDVRVRESLADSAHWPGPVLVNPDSFRFAVLTDLHFGCPESARLGWFKSEAVRLGVDFFLVLGDITENGRAEEYDAARHRLDSLAIPYYATIGNHDLYQRDGWSSFLSHFGPSCYSVVIGERLRLIFLDTGDGRLGQTQFEWLEDELQNAEAVKVVATHFPICEGAVPLPGRLASTAERYKLISLLERSGVRAYIAGHTHGFRRTRIENLDHFIAGSMAPKKLDYGRPGFLYFTVLADSLCWDWVEYRL